MSEKQLEPGKTIIKTMAGTVDGKYAVFNVYYGNFVYPVFNERNRIKDRNVYLKYLEEFLNTEEGMQYAMPTKEQRAEAEEIVKQRYVEFISEAQNQYEPQPEKDDKDDKVQDAEIVKHAPSIEKPETKMEFEDDKDSEANILSAENEKLLKEKEKLEKQLEKANRKNFMQKRARSEKINDRLITMLSVFLIIESLTIAVFMYLYAFMR